MKAPRGQVGYAVVLKGRIVNSWKGRGPFLLWSSKRMATRALEARRSFHSGETIRRIRLQVPEGEHE